METTHLLLYLQLELRRPCPTSLSSLFSDDTPADLAALVKKILSIKIFPPPPPVTGDWKATVQDISGEILCGELASLPPDFGIASLTVFLLTLHSISVHSASTYATRSQARLSPRNGEFLQSKGLKFDLSRLLRRLTSVSSPFFLQTEPHRRQNNVRRLPRCYGKVLRSSKDQRCVS